MKTFGGELDGGTPGPLGGRRLQKSPGSPGRFKVPAESLSSKLANLLGTALSVERGRIEVRFDGGEGRRGTLIPGRRHPKYMEIHQ